MQKIFFILLMISCAKGVYGAKENPNDCLKLVNQRLSDEATVCLLTQEARSVEYWKKRLKDKLENKVFFADDILRDYVRLENKVYSFENIPLKVKSDLVPMINIVKSVLMELPNPIKKMLNKRFGGIGLLENFGGTGYTTTIVNSKLKIVGSFILLDPRNLQKKANEWNTWKENTPFKRGEYKIVTTIENEKNNSINKAVEYILLHEIGHVLSINETLLEPWESGMEYSKYYNRPIYEYISWKKTKDLWTTKKPFPNRKKIVYYWGAKLANNEILNIYNEFEKSSFPTLYAVTSIPDDFADSFVNFVHVNMLKRPWEIRILKDGKIIKTIKNCWEQERCKEKKKFFQNLFNLK